MKQTAVEWLIEKMLDKGIGICREWREQAKEMEKQQIIDAQSYAISNADMSNNRGYFDCEKWFAETYGSKGSDETLKENHIGDINEMVDQVPDVRKMVEDDNYLTPVDWLMDRIKWINRETYDYLIKEGQYDRAKRMENPTSSHTELSDEEIEKFTNEFAEKYSKVGITENEVSAFFTGMKWYREQLKQRQ